MPAQDIVGNIVARQPHHAGQTEEVTQMLSIYVVHLQWEPL